MSKETKRTIAKMCEIMNIIEHLTLEDIEKGIGQLVLKGVLKSYCYILHDKDTYTKEDEEANSEHKEETLKKPHYHVFIQFNRDVDFNTIAKIFNQKINYINKIKASSFKQAIPYLIHKNQSDKFQYDAKEVVANFDYIKCVETTQKKQTSEERLNEIIELIDNGTIKEYNYTEYLSMKEYTLYNSKIEKAFRYRIVAR